MKQEGKFFGGGAGNGNSHLSVGVNENVRMNGNIFSSKNNNKLVEDKQFKYKDAL